MAYVTRLVGKEEKLIGVAHLHYIYVLRGAAWLLFMSLCGLGLSYVMGMGLGSVSAYFDTMTSERAVTLTSIMLNIQHYTLMFCIGVGGLFFMLYLIKFLVTEVALTSRRVIHKEGWIFVDVRQIDLEEIRGESLDTGAFGRMLNYGYLLLDCRFLGDVKIPAIAKAEAFLKALHYHRAQTQDAVSVVVGKGNPAPVEILAPQPEISTGPVVEVSPERTKIDPRAKVPVESVKTSEPVQPPPSPAQAPLQASAKAVDVEIVAKIVSQVVPEIVKEMADKGLIAGSDQNKQPSPAADNHEEELASAFDDAAFKTEARSVEESIRKRALH